MNRGLLAVAVAGGLLAGCASPRDMFSAGSSDPATFVYVAQSYDLFPTRRYESEVRRLQDLQQYLASNRLCGDGYEVDSRTESVNGGNAMTKYFQGQIYEVTYRGHCTPPSASTAPAMTSAPASSPVPDSSSAPGATPVPAVTAAPLESPVPPSSIDTTTPSSMDTTMPPSMYTTSPSSMDATTPSSMDMTTPSASPYAPAPSYDSSMPTPAPTPTIDLTTTPTG